MAKKMFIKNIAIITLLIINFCPDGVHAQGNNHLSSAVVVDADPYFVIEDGPMRNWDGSRENWEEEQTCVFNDPNRSLWWEYTPTLSGELYVDTFGSNFPMVIGVWQGTQHPLNEIACDAAEDSGTSIRMEVVAGNRYYVRVSSYVSSVQSFHLLIDGPSNDLGVIHVDASATMEGDGSSWSNSVSDLQKGLKLGRKGAEVWISAGTYKTARDNDRVKAFVLYDGARVFGGFGGTESNRDERNLEANRTVLSGDIGLPGFPNDNSFHVLVVSGDNASTLVDGVIVTGGYANGHDPLIQGSFVQDFGGGIVLRGSPILRNVSFVENYAASGGGAVYIEDGRAYLSNVFFARNATDGDAFHTGGGALFLDRGEADISEAEFIGNAAYEKGNGGAVFVQSGRLNVYESKFVGNSTSDGDGGAVHMGQRYTNSLFVRNNLFVGNVAKGSTGSGRGLGGGIVLGDGISMIAGCVFAGNVSDKGGSAIHLNSGASGAQYVILNSSFNENEGTAIELELDRITFAIYNSIIWDRIEVTGDAPFIKNSILKYGLPAVVYDGGGNLSTDPLFVDADGLDNVYGTSDDNLRLQAGSPAADAGSNDVLDLNGNGSFVDDIPFDPDGNLRIYNEIVDIGAFEQNSHRFVMTEPELELPEVVKLRQNFPNPFNPTTNISFSLPHNEEVQLVIFDVLGREVKRLIDGPMTAGNHVMTWNAGDVPSGVYIYRLAAGSFVEVRAMVLAK